MSGITLVSSNACFEGFQKVYSHDSEELKCKMNFAIYLPPQAETSENLPILYWLSGLTCNEQNFITKAGAQRYAAEHGIVIVCPDTSPRNVNIPGEDESYDFGSGAGFYVDATQEPWKTNYRMFSYVTNELVNLIAKEFGNTVDTTRQSIIGHSMGGHGALICALKKPGLYKSVSAFAPICNPIECPWGVKAFTGYLGPKESGKWEEWDAVELVKSYNGPPLTLLIQQGKADNFFKEKQLLPGNLLKSCQENSLPCILKMNEDYDHSYYFIASYIGEHIEFHSKILKASN
ncbi:S-formylglutathione hydrolase [Arctopsyche grandis]|uniref:S-formylglutathione hydrolase n=1 Tax=Arctopsyche grandis TaxID=121162 RepID=UPI00406D94AF